MYRTLAAIKYDWSIDETISGLRRHQTAGIVHPAILLKIKKNKLHCETINYTTEVSNNPYWEVVVVTSIGDVFSGLRRRFIDNFQTGETPVKSLQLKLIP